MGNIEIPRGSVEYLHTPVTSDVTLADVMVVAIAVGRTGTETYTWLPATWEGTAGTTRTARTTSAVTLSAASYPLRKYTIYVKLTDTPEAPIIDAGTLTIT
jgi:hypothetical protein